MPALFFRPEAVYRPALRILRVVILAGLGILAARAEDWVVNGKTYHNVTVDRVDGQDVHITFDDGITTLAMADLPPDVQKRLTPAPDTDAQKVKAFEAQVKASEVFTIRIGNTDLKFCNPAGMIEIKTDDPMAQTVKDLVPDNCVLLRDCVSADAYDPVKSEDAETNPKTRENIMMSSTYMFKDAQMDIDPDRFIDFVDYLAGRVNPGILLSKESIVDNADMQSRLDQFQKDTGIGVEQTSDIYSLGLISRSEACVSFLSARYLNETYQGKTRRFKMVSLESYLLLNHKVVVVETSLTKNWIRQNDVLELVKVGEIYQLALQVLNE